MYILQISDFHITPNTELQAQFKKIDLLKEYLLKNIPKGADVAVCVLGDIIDKGHIEGYGKAEKIIGKLKDGLVDYNTKFLVVPGNHDICTEQNNRLEAFDKFACKIEDDEFCLLNDKGIIVYNFCNYQFVMISSLKGNIKEYGKIDFEQIEMKFKHDKKLREAKKIFLMHHALLSCDDEDEASIRNGYKLQKLLEGYNSVAMLHGHTHGYRKLIIGERCHVIGVGSFLKDEKDIPNQCNLIKVTGGHVKEIKVVSYKGDQEAWFDNCAYVNEYQNSYIGSNIRHVYNEILDDVNENGYLMNLKAVIKMGAKDFIAEIDHTFSEVKKDAEDWQKNVKPRNLRHNHGEYMKVAGTDWKEIIVKMLDSNPTKKRAIISLLSSDTLNIDNLDGDMLSLNIIQFGFPNEKKDDLHITFYYRALEVRKFLKINIYEARLILEEILTEIGSICKVTFCIFAFRAEGKDNYPCCRLLELDSISEASLTKLLIKKEFKKIKGLLEEKGQYIDTVIDDGWIAKFRNVIEVVIEDADDRNKLLSLLKDVGVANDNWKREREKTSSYDKTKNVENILSNAIKSLAEEIDKYGAVL